jgi:MFS family permease
MRNFFVLWLGQTISLLGSGLTSFALGVWIYAQTGQATPFALTVLFGALPRILLAPLGGSLADRRNRKTIMLLADTGNALVTAAAALIAFSGHLQIWNIYLLAAFGSVFAAFQEPAFSASIVMLVPKKDLGRASGLRDLSEALGSLVTPMLGGLLFSLIGLGGVMLIDFITYFFALGAMLITRIPQPELTTATGSRQHWLADAAFGWRYLRQRQGLFILLWYFALVNFLLNVTSVLTSPLVLSRNSAVVLGAVEMAAGAGMLLGSLAMSIWGGPRKRIHGVIGFIVVAAVGLSIIGIRPNPWVIGAGYFLMLFGIPLASGSSRAIFASKVQPDVQGRVFAIRTMISQSMMPVAFLLAGPLADQVFEPLMRTGGALAGSPVAALIGQGIGRGMGLMFVLSGLALLLVTLIVWGNPRIRRIEEELPDMVPEDQPAPEPAPAG